jgi:hypothetical protein
MPKQVKHSWKKDISQTMSAVQSRAAWQDELAGLFAPHMQALTKAGHTPSSYIKTLIGVAHQIEQAPAETLGRLAQRYGVMPDDGSGLDPLQAAQFHDAWSRFVREHPDAEARREAMGQVLMGAPERQGETMSTALERAYAAVSPEPAASPEQRRAADQPATLGGSGEDYSWRQAASDAWDEVGGDEAEATPDADEQQG